MIIGVYGYQDSGKTTLVEQLIERLKERGLTVSSIKHAPHVEEIDVAGKDSRRHSDAGSDPVVLETESGCVIFKRPRLDLVTVIELLDKAFPTDVLIVEGHKDGDFPKIALGDVSPTEGTVLVNPDLDETISFIEKELAVEKILERLPRLDCGRCGLSCADLAREITDGTMSLDDCSEIPARKVEILVGGEKLPVGAFVAEITEKTVRGLLSSLKGYTDDAGIEIRLCPPSDKTGSDDCDD